MGLLLSMLWGLPSCRPLSARHFATHYLGHNVHSGHYYLRDALWQIPKSASMAFEQKAALSRALMAFLQACSGPVEGCEDEHDAPLVWPQAVSILRMREATLAMAEVACAER